MDVPRVQIELPRVYVESLVEIADHLIENEQSFLSVHVEEPLVAALRASLLEQEGEA